MSLYYKVGSILMQEKTLYNINGINNNYLSLNPEKHVDEKSRRNHQALQTR